MTCTAAAVRFREDNGPAIVLSNLPAECAAKLAKITYPGTFCRRVVQVNRHGFSAVIPVLSRLSAEMRSTRPGKCRTLTARLCRRYDHSGCRTVDLAEGRV